MTTTFPPPHLEMDDATSADTEVAEPTEELGYLHHGILD